MRASILTLVNRLAGAQRSEGLIAVATHAAPSLVGKLALLIGEQKELIKVVFVTVKEKSLAFLSSTNTYFVSRFLNSGQSRQGCGLFCEAKLARAGKG